MAPQFAAAAKTLPLPASKKTRALLGYVVATGRPHLREKLCELLWPGPDDPRAALDGGPTTADATALTPVMTYSLERGALNRLLCLHAPIAEAVLIYLCRRISATSAQVDGAPTRGLFSDLGSSESRFAKRRIS